jgi:hypothetical protein
MTSTLDRFKIALAIHSNCFSLERAEKALQVMRRMTYLPCRKVLATFRHRRVEIAEHVGVYIVFLLYLISRRDQVDATQRFVLIIINEP